MSLFIYLKASDDTSEDFEANTSKLKQLNKHRQQYNSSVGGGNAGSSHRHHFKDDWNSSEDTNERYCICKDVSYGDMIACDNSRCATQWFHFVCVGLNSAPKGKWFCPMCVDIKKKRKEKHLNAILMNQHLQQQQQQQQQQISSSSSSNNANNPGDGFTSVPFLPPPGHSDIVGDTFQQQAAPSRAQSNNNNNTTNNNLSQFISNNSSSNSTN